jgi:uncharacterized lipoprotein YajG
VVYHVQKRQKKLKKPNQMKKILMIIVLFSLLFSCRSRQPILQNAVKDTFVVHDTVVVNHSKTINQAIVDSVNFFISKIKTQKPECDSITQAAIDNLLQSINQQRQSGNNGYSLKYDELNRKLQLLISIGATHSQSNDSIKTKTVVKTQTQTVEVAVQKPLLPIQKFLIIAGIIGVLIPIVKLLFLIRSKIPI